MNDAQPSLRWKVEANKYLRNQVLPISDDLPLPEEDAFKMDLNERALKIVEGSAVESSLNDLYWIQPVRQCPVELLLNDVLLIQPTPAYKKASAYINYDPERKN